MSLSIVVSQLLAPFDTKVRSYLGGLSKQRNRNDGVAKLIASSQQGTGNQATRNKKFN